jgi:fructokinase
MKKIVLSYGEILWDLLPTDTVLGGAPCNFAYRVNSLGDMGLIISKLGSDDLGKKAFEQVASIGLETTYLQWDDSHPTGTVPITFDENNNPDFTIIPDVAYDYIVMTDSLRKIAPKADCLCFGTLSQRSAKSRQTLEELIEISSDSLKLLDINLRKECYSLDTIKNSIKKADLLKLNENELYQLAEMLRISKKDQINICLRLMDKYSLKCCVVTLGDKGIFAISEEGEIVYEPGYKIDLVDSVGAGDAFTAGFAYCTLRDLFLREACQFGNILGAIACTKKGATSPITQDEIDSFKNREIERIYDHYFEKLTT